MFSKFVWRDELQDLALKKKRNQNKKRHYFLENIPDEIQLARFFVKKSPVKVDCIFPLKYKGWLVWSLKPQFHRRSTETAPEKVQPVDVTLSWVDSVDEVGWPFVTWYLRVGARSICMYIYILYIYTYYIYIYTGWWFGCHLDYIFPLILGISSSQLTFIFFRGVFPQPPSRYNGWLRNDETVENYPIVSTIRNHPLYPLIKLDMLLYHVYPIFMGFQHKYMMRIYTLW